MLTTVRILQSKLQELIPGYYHYWLDTTKFINTDHTSVNRNFFANTVNNRVDFTIFDVSDEPWGEALTEQVYDLCQQHGYKKFLIFSHSLKYDYNPAFNNIIYFPHNYFDCIFGWDRESALKNVEVYNRSYFVSCLNRQPRISRIYNYLGLSEKPYYSNSLITIYNLENSTTYRDQWLNEWLDENMWSKWNSILPSLPTVCPNDLDIDHPAYHDAYINLITETFTQPNTLFLTEKVWKPIACGQMFMVIGSTGILSYLKSIGFDTYDDIIDHNRYQHISDWKARIDAIHELLDELYKLDWAEIYAQTRNRRISNARHFWSGLAVKSTMERVATRMSEIDSKEYRYNYNTILNLHNLRDSIYAGLPMINHLFRN